MSEISAGLIPWWLRGTKTEVNAILSFAGESQARNRYSYFASQARKEGYEQRSAIYWTRANNEKEYAKVFFKLLESGMADIAAAPIAQHI